MGRPVAVILLVVGVLSGMVSPTQSGATSDPWVCGAYDQTAEAGRKATPDGNGTTHPIVFIHGITDSDAAWTAKLDRSDNPYTKLDPPRSFVDQMVGMDGATGTVPQGIKHAQVYTFSYTKNSLRWVDDEHVGGEFAKTIDCLYEKHGTPVAVVAHSMGGLVTRWVANTDDGEGQPRSEKLGKIITIGTPYDGSALATVANAGIDAASNPALPTNWLLWLMTRACGDRGTATGDGDCALLPGLGSLKSEAGKKLAWKSSAIRALDRWPSTSDVSAVAGSMPVPIGLFEAPLIGEQSVDLGDVVVTTASATADPGPTRVETCDFSKNASVMEKLSQLRRGGDRLNRLGAMTVASACYHSNLTKNVEIGVYSLGLMADWVEAQSASISEIDLTNATLPAGSCRSPEAWTNDVPIPLNDGKGEAENSDGSWASVMGISVAGYGDLDGDGTEDALISAECTGGTLEGCCAGQTSLLIVGLAVRQGPNGLELIGDPLWPSDRGESLVTTDSLELDGTTAVLHERFARPGEQDCCRTASAPSRWTYSKGTWNMEGPVADTSPDTSTSGGLVMTEQSLGPVSIGDEPAMATAEFSKLLGPPQREGEAPTECMGTGPVDSQMVSWPGLTIISIDEGSGVRVYSISLNSQGDLGGSTAAGLRVGSQESELLNLYSDAAGQRNDYPSLEGASYDLGGALSAFVADGEVTALSLNQVVCT
ncbi:MULTISPECIES: esterase/lipase family protein [Candidatus Microthrix]|jgi:pimeloyl-ACP methyl ester carboxylesterase|uniref:GPI inositol-deacylase PGAP1-like alpha/beta domain-containing protein n=1 Tax=Candidatus Neomicrothrix parvicella RN1 TaxID=1229780 RepID=R4YZC1_9ACTN|nr:MULTISPECIES: hypothetical protein [Microthrix]MBP7876737.1 hypothetical protein [Candidatus Microthrix sp.]CCM63999.1 exported hypothetical protein [Candidatus Microthrix parvicella RN1]